MHEICVHLHPDFAAELDAVLVKWNQVQDAVTFRGIRPSLEYEAQLLSPGSIPLSDTGRLADKIRSDASSDPNADVIIFTEKRIHQDQYYQLFFGGEDNWATISLDFLRKLFASADDRMNYMFRAILNIILSAVAQREGFQTHDETRGCILDFCNNMPDIIKGIEGGPRFCRIHHGQIHESNKEFLLKLVESTRDSDSLAQQDIEVTRRVNLFDSPVDIGIVVALKEEFRELFERIAGQAKPVIKEDINQYYYVFETGTGADSYRCAATLIGGMGIDKAALAADRLMAQFHPATIINIGIAGSMDSDVRVGDVVVAEQANNYLASAKAIAGPYAATLSFQLSGDPYKSTPKYVADTKNLEFAHMERFNKWRSACTKKLNELVEKESRDELRRKGMIGNAPSLYEGNIASGTIVGASALFAEWLKAHGDRKYLAIEMESAGVMAAAHTRPTDTLVIRGISDFSDERKKELDRVHNGSLRRYGMHNALDALWTLIDLNVFRRTHPSPSPSS